MNGLRAVMLGIALPSVIGLPVFAATNGTGSTLTIAVDAKGGGYSIGADGVAGAVLRAQPAVRVDGKWIYAKNYPTCTSEHTTAQGELGSATEWRLHCSGMPDAPDLVLRLRTYENKPFGDMQLTARNTSQHEIHIQSLRLIDAQGDHVIQLGGDPATERVLSDSFSEDRPGMQLRDLNGAEKMMHRAVGSQLIYDQKSRKSWFIGTLTSEKFLTVLRLRMAG